MRALGPDGGTAWTALANSTTHPDGATIERPEDEALAELGDAAIGFARFDDEGKVERVELTPRGLRSAPPLWFAEVDESDATPPAVTVIAFSGHDVEPGRLVDRAALGATGVVSADQLGAFRWYPATGEVDQVYVSPAWRRRNIATVIISAVAIITFARDWPALWGDGQRTAEGDRMAQAAMWGQRTKPLTHLAPPMTPFEDRRD